MYIFCTTIRLSFRVFSRVLTLTRLHEPVMRHHHISSYNTVQSYCVCTLTDDLLKVMHTSELFIPTNKLTVIYIYACDSL